MIAIEEANRELDPLRKVYYYGYPGRNPLVELSNIRGKGEIMIVTPRISRKKVKISDESFSIEGFICNMLKEGFSIRLISRERDIKCEDGASRSRRSLSIKLFDVPDGVIMIIAPIDPGQRCVLVTLSADFDNGDLKGRGLIATYIRDPDLVDLGVRIFNDLWQRADSYSRSWVTNLHSI